MDNIDKYIDNLFEQKLSGASMPGASTGADWANIGKVLQKKSFLKFAVAKFNVYYLSTIIVATITAGALFIPPFFKAEPKESEIIESIITLDDTIESTVKEDVILDSVNVEINNPIIEKSEQSIIEPIIKTEISVSTPIECKSEELINTPITDTCLASKKLPELYIEPDSIVMYETLIPVVKTDTIVQIDTLTVTKKRLMLRRKK